MTNYERYLQSIYRTKQTKADSDLALSKKKRADDLTKFLLGYKGLDLASNLRNQHIRTEMTGKDLYYNKEGMPIHLSRGFENKPKNMIDTLRRNVWSKKSDYTPMDYSNLSTYKKGNPFTSSELLKLNDAEQFKARGIVPENFSAAEGASGPLSLSSPLNLLSLAQNVQGMNTTGARTHSERTKHLLDSGADTALNLAMFTPMAPFAGGLKLAKSLISNLFS